MIFFLQKTGCEHSIAISLNGELYTWGHGDSGRLGHGDDRTTSIPKKVMLENHIGCDERTKVVSVAVGDKYNLILVAQDDDVKENNNSTTTTTTSTPTSVNSNTLIETKESKNNETKEESSVTNHTDALQSTNQTEENITPEWILNLSKFQLSSESSAEIIRKGIPFHDKSSACQIDNVPVVISTHLARIVDPLLQNTDHLVTSFNNTNNNPNNFNHKNFNSNISNNNNKHKRQRPNNETSSSINQQWSTITKKPYCIETSEQSILLFERLLRLCMEKKQTGDLNTWCIVWSILRVLRANVSQLVQVLQQESDENNIEQNQQQQKENEDVMFNTIKTPGSPGSPFGPESSSPTIRPHQRSSGKLQRNQSSGGTNRGKVFIVFLFC